MEWLNESAGLIALVSGVLTVAILVVVLVLVLSLRNRIAVQRLKMLGFYSTDPITRENYAELTVGNKSINDIGIAEIGIRNGKVNFDLTPLFRRKKAFTDSSRIVIEQRSSVTFRLSEEELSLVLVDTPRGKHLGVLRLYVVDFAGNFYRGSIHNVRKLMKNYLLRQKLAAQGKPVPVPPVRLPASEAPAPVEAPAEAVAEAPVEAPAEAPVSVEAPAEAPAEEPVVGEPAAEASEPAAPAEEKGE